MSAAGGVEKTDTNHAVSAPDVAPLKQVEAAPGFLAALGDSRLIGLDLAVAIVDEHPDYRVLRRFVPRKRYAVEEWNLGDLAPARRGLYVDVEGTGLDTENDEIIELSLVPFSYNAQLGVVYDVDAPVSCFNEPSRPIPPEIVELTGITPEMVAGKSLPLDALTDVMRFSDLVIAHNASYDRQMIERYLPIADEKAWACSQREVEWKKFGVHGGALQNILMSACGEFCDGAHRGEADCHVGLHVLAAAMFEGRTAFSYLLESARQPTLRVCAVNSPMSAKDALRARGYRALYTNGRFQYWYKDLREGVAAEVEWCERHAGCTPIVEEFSAYDRYSVRASS